MSETKHYLSRERVDELVPKLDTVADVVEELAVALTGQAINRRPQESGHGQPCSRPPYPMDVEDLRDQLIDTLDRAADAICVHRTQAYRGSSSPIGKAAFLRANRVALTTMDAGVDLHHALCDVIDRCNRVVNRDELVRHIPLAAVVKANRQVVTAGQMERIARQLGDRGHGLTARRIDSLRRRGKLAGWQGDGGGWFYRVGDVLAAHEAAKMYRTRGRIQGA